MFPGKQYVARSDGGRRGSGDGFTLRELLDANFQRVSGNIFIVGRPSFPDPDMDSAYDLVPVGLVRQVVRRDKPIATASWTALSLSAWDAVVQAFGSPSEESRPSDVYVGLGTTNAGDGVGSELVEHADGSLILPQPDKYGPEWWESTLRIIVYDAAAETAAFGLERAIAVPPAEQGEEERMLMVYAALFLEAVVRRDGRRYDDVLRPAEHSGASCIPMD